MANFSGSQETRRGSNPVSPRNAQGLQPGELRRRVGPYNPYRFTGRRFDGETGLSHFRTRYFHAEIGNFISRDAQRSSPSVPSARDGYTDGMNFYSGYFVPNLLDPAGFFGLHGQGAATESETCSCSSGDFLVAVDVASHDPNGYRVEIKATGVLCCKSFYWKQRARVSYGYIDGARVVTPEFVDGVLPNSESDQYPHGRGGYLPAGWPDAYMDDHPHITEAYKEGLDAVSWEFNSQLICGDDDTVLASVSWSQHMTRLVNGVWSQNIGGTIHCSGGDPDGAFGDLDEGVTVSGAVNEKGRLVDGGGLIDTGSWE
jgi:RHS repeat-associated protein